MVRGWRDDKFQGEEEEVARDFHEGTDSPTLWFQLQGRWTQKISFE